MAKNKRRSDGWTNIYTQLGNSLRDKRLGGSFSADTLAEPDCEELWQGNALCARIVETEPEMMLREGFEVVINDTAKAPAPDAPDRMDAIEKAGDMGTALSAKLDELDATSHQIHAMSMARAYGGAAILVGANDGQDFKEPLDERRIASLQWLKVLRPRECYPSRYYRNPKNPKFGEVSHFLVNRETLGGGTAQTIEVHESRLILFYGNVVSTRQRARNRGWGDSVFVRVLEAVRDFQSSHQATGILLQDFAQAVFKLNGLAQLMASGDDDVVTARATAIDLSRSVARAIIIDKDEEFERKATPTAGLPELLDRQANYLASQIPMPVTLLMGQAPAGLNATGDSDLRNFYDSIVGRRERILRPRTNRLVRLLMLSKDGPTKGVEPMHWRIQYRPLYQLTETELADMRQKQSATDVAYINSGVVTPEEVAVSRFGGDEWSSETHLDTETRAVEPVVSPAQQQAAAVAKAKAEIQGAPGKGAPSKASPDDNKPGA